MKVKVSEATTLQLDWLVAKCDGIRLWRDTEERIVVRGGRVYHFLKDWINYSPSTDWEEGGPIIERLGLHVNPSMRGDCWLAAGKGALDLMKGPTPLIAACRCYVASKLGDEVDVPDELMAA